MNNTCLLLALGVVIFVIMQNKGGLKGSLSVKSLSKSSKSVMNTNVPIICVCVLFLVYMFMNNVGIEGFSGGNDNICGVRSGAEDDLLSFPTSMPSGTVKDAMLAFAAEQRKEINEQASSMSGACPGDNHCKRCLENGTINPECGYFYHNFDSDHLHLTGQEAPILETIEFKKGVLHSDDGGTLCNTASTDDSTPDSPPDSPPDSQPDSQPDSPDDSTWVIPTDRPIWHPDPSGPRRRSRLRRPPRETSAGGGT